MSKQTLTQKTFSKYREPLVPIPNLVETQITSYKWFIENGLKDTIKEFFPIADYSGNKFELTCEGFELLAPEFDEYHAKQNRLTYEAQLKATIKLHNKSTDSDKVQEVFLSEIPMMTSHGTFVINGTERVVVPQLARSYGVFFTETNDKFGLRFGAKIIPARGAWIEIDTEKDGVIIVRIDKKRKFVITSLLRVLGLETTEKIKAAFKDDEKALGSIEAALARDSVENGDGAFIEIHKNYETVN